MSDYDLKTTFKNGDFALWGDGYSDDRLIKFLPSLSANIQRENSGENSLEKKIKLKK